MSLAPFPELIARDEKGTSTQSRPPILIFLIKFCGLAYTGGWVTFFPFSSFSSEDNVLVIQILIASWYKLSSTQMEWL